MAHWHHGRGSSRPARPDGRNRTQLDSRARAQPAHLLPDGPKAPLLRGISPHYWALNQSSSDLHWCGVRTSNPGVFLGTRVQFSILNDRSCSCRSSRHLKPLHGTHRLRTPHTLPELAQPTVRLQRGAAGSARPSLSFGHLQWLRHILFESLKNNRSLLPVQLILRFDGLQQVAELAGARGGWFHGHRIHGLVPWRARPGPTWRSACWRACCWGRDFAAFKNLWKFNFHKWFPARSTLQPSHALASPVLAACGIQHAALGRPKVHRADLPRLKRRHIRGNRHGGPGERAEELPRQLPLWQISAASSDFCCRLLCFIGGHDTGVAQSLRFLVLSRLNTWNRPVLRRLLFLFHIYRHLDQPDRLLHKLLGLRLLLRQGSYRHSRFAAVAAAFSSTPFP